MLTILAAEFCNCLDEEVSREAARVFSKHAEENARHELVKRVALTVCIPVRIITHYFIVKLRKTTGGLDVSGIFFDRLILVDASKGQEEVEMIVQRCEIAVQRLVSFGIERRCFSSI